MKYVVLAWALGVMSAPVVAAEYVATGDWAPTRQAACEQATALAKARTDAPMRSSKCICDKGDKRFSCLATIEVVEPAPALAQEGRAALAKPGASQPSADHSSTR